MEEDDPLVLEHMMGFNGEKPGAVQFHPIQPNVMIAYTGCLVVISEVNDPHKQEFLRGHNEAITCLAISPSGNLIASGQTSTTRVPNSEAIIIVWDFNTRSAMYRLMELHDGIQFSRNSVIKLAFSHDDAFLAGADDQPGGPKLAVWHTNNAQLAVLKKCTRQQSFLSWGKVFTNPKRRNNAEPSYELITAMDEKVLTRTMAFDHVTMQYAMTETQMQLPSSGLMRSYNCAHAVCNGSELIAGSAAGELCVFNVETQVFKACVPVSKGGLLALAVRADPSQPGATIAYCGCGDGVLKVLQGGDLQWVCLNETSVEGMILSVTLSADHKEVSCARTLARTRMLLTAPCPEADTSQPHCCLWAPVVAHAPRPAALCEPCRGFSVGGARRGSHAVQRASHPHWCAPCAVRRVPPACQVMVGTSVGNIYRLDATSLEKLDMHGQRSEVPLLASHPRAISCLAFGASSEWFLTASEVRSHAARAESARPRDALRALALTPRRLGCRECRSGAQNGTMRRWELSQYGVDYEIQSRVKTCDPSNVPHAECLAIRHSKEMGSEVTLSGWTDGCVRAYDVNNGRCVPP